ncbi:hypothetical protein [Bacteroides reticulotermitis]|mgnify:CR=1 FL=1|uniref:Uncharacterized protein n=1 Tax=Bacteroides reticulotermitis TaxID=1133319 RepID=A0A840CVN7_9BACE|nr:hypothetical protein [Bacteroides reticulotermitis]MBB4043386.1 hypothetical protein [Bacteroides reticulotermitis]
MRRILYIIWLAVSILPIAIAQDVSYLYKDTSLTSSERADGLLSRLSLREKSIRGCT